MKQRFSSLDVRVIAYELSNKLTGLRVHNIYDLSSRIFLIKFQAPNTRHHLLIDSGFRCHLTSFVRTTAAAPSPFVSKLRKSLKTRRVTSVRQVGTDRVIEFQFSDGLFRLYLEFYASGNIILTDQELKIMTLLRKVDEGPEDEQVKVGSKYSLESRQNYGGIPALTKERVRDGLQKTIDKQQGEEDEAPKRPRRKAQDSLRKALAVTISEYPPVLIDHCFRRKEFEPSTRPDDVCKSEELLDKLLEVLEEAKRIASDITTSEVAKGYIIGKIPKNEVVQHPAAEKQGLEGLMYEDFQPFRPKQFEDNPELAVVEIEGFNSTVDEFYSSIEGQKLESRLAEREATAKKKLEATRQEHERRLGGLQQVQELNVRKAEAIQANVARVEEATAAVNGLLAQGMDWVDMARFIEQEQSRGNPVANSIKLPLKLYENTITLLLGEAEDDDERDSGYGNSDTESESASVEEEQTSGRKREETRLEIDVNLSLSAWANASQYYDNKKVAAEKTEKTLQASTKALKSAEQKIAADLKKGLTQEKDILRPIRKQFWFEKFLYFISSDGYLVLGGKDAQQNELLYRRYLKRGDIYVHADLNGAPSVIIKNNPSTPDAPIPPSTLSQAGSLAVSASEAWEAKAIMAAWWVNADQVSKTAPTGEYITTGAFMVRGKKNFLPPTQLLMGFALIWQISEESKDRHLKHRVQDTEREPNLLQEDAEDEHGEEAFPDAKPYDDETDSDGDFPDAKPNAGSEDEGDDTTRISPQYGDDDGEFVMSGANAVNGDTAKEGGRRHLSARERRQLKKAKELQVDQKSNDFHEALANGSEDNQSVNSGYSTPKPKQQPLPRDKRTKAKRAAERYADQDEEDRELAMKLLGVRMSNEAKAAKAAESKAKEEQERKDKERRRQQHIKKLTEEEKKRTVAASEDLVETADDGEQDTAWKNELMTLDTLVGKPLPGDELLSAIPLCAPWNALANYKYKVKLQPGTTKKGKAVREILGKWGNDAKNAKLVDPKAEDVERIWPQEVELLKGVKEAEAVGVVPLKSCRVMTAGSAASGGKDGGRGKGKPARGGKGSKKQR